MKLLTRFNVWYDSLPGTTRFMLFFIMFLSWYVPLTLTVYENIGNNVLQAIGVVNLAIMVCIALSRI